MANRPGSVILRSFAIIILAVLPVITSFGQAPPPGAPADWHFVFAGKVTEFNEKKQKDLPLEGCTVALTKSGSPVETQVTDKSGKFKFALPPNGDYQISISKGDYINKRIAINTYNVPNERTHHPFTEFDVEIDLFKTFPGLDYGCLNKPIARIIYSPAPETDDFDYDKVYTAQIQACIENLKRLAADAKAKQKLYAAAVDEADRLFAANDFSNAKVKYNAALAILPNEQYPKDQIKKCDEKLGASAKLEADYKAAVDDGNAKFAAKDYAGAKARYQAASNLKPAEPYPKERMTACDAAIAGSAKEKQYTDALADADKKFTAKDFTGAKAGYQAASAMKPAEQYPKDRIKACDDGLAGAAKEKQYTDALADADKKFTAKDFTGAKAGYQAASSMKPAEQYPKDRIKTCDEEIAKLGKDKLYSDAIADADKKFDAKDFNGAKAKYQEATGIKPGEQYPRDRIRVCLDEIAKAGKEKTYNDVIAAADQKFTSRDFNGAKAKYQEAFGLKPGEQYPIDRIKACDDEIEKSEKDAEYTGILKQADEKFAARDYKGAKVIYQQASVLRSAELYPRNKIKECDERISSAGNEKKYNDLILLADQKFESTDWKGAKAYYVQASGLMPGQQYPKDRIKACDDKMAVAYDKNYVNLIRQADEQFALKDWAGAKELYLQALKLKAEEKYPKDQVKLCETNLVVDAEGKYKSVVAAGDARFQVQDYVGAKAKYQEALTLKPAEQYPKDRIKACDDGLAKSVVDKEYNDFIRQANTKFTAKDWAAAKSLYLQATEVKPGEQYPKDQAKLCDTYIAASGVDKQYNDLIRLADGMFAGKAWSKARDVYQQASAVKPAEQYPKDRIKACDQEIVKSGNEKIYTDAITDADKKFALKDYAGAKAKYQEAAAARPAEEYPKGRIKICEDELAKAAKDKLYKDAIASADKKFASKDFSGAKANYQEASVLKPAEQYPLDRIKACDEGLAGAAKDKQYTDALAAADKKFAAKDFTGAKTGYQAASEMKPAEQYPKDRMKACDNAISGASKEKQYLDVIAVADKKFAAKDYPGAKAGYQEAAAIKPAEQYPKDRIRACDDAVNSIAKNKQYTEVIAAADKKFAARDYVAAKTGYQSASVIKPSEQYPKDRIIICDDEIAKAGKDKSYSDAIADADKKFTAKDFAAAKAGYRAASGIKPAEQYPKDRIKACDDEIAKAGKEKTYADAIAEADNKFVARDFTGAKAGYESAVVIKPAEQYPKDRIKACDEEIAKAGREKTYSDVIADADKKFDAKDYAGAKAGYQSASGIKPAEQYPKDRINACDVEIANTGKDKNYSDAIAAADKKFDAKDYAGAKAGYQSASGIKPAEQYPKDRINACEEELAKAGKKDKTYSDAIADADKKFSAKDYAGAKAGYQSASGLKPAEQYPKDRIRICDEEIALAGKEKLYRDAIADADKKFIAKDYAGAKAGYQSASVIKPGELYPKDRINACDIEIAKAGKDQTYSDAIAAADKKFDAKDYTGAKAGYQSASGIKPTEQYPKDRINICDVEIAKAGKDKNFSDAIADANKKFDAKDYAGAKAKYQEAAALKPAEKYPQDQVKLCDTYLAAAGVDKKYNDLLKQADAGFAGKSWTQAKGLYQQASAVKPEEQYPKDQIKLCDENNLVSANKAYNDLLAAANARFGAADWSGAKSKYIEASALRPSELYPKDQMKICDAKIAAAGKDVTYQAILKIADEKFMAGDWMSAKSKYQEALGVKPSEQYPKSQLTLCNDAINAIASKESLYKQYILRGDSALTIHDLETAQSSFIKAKEIKPTEIYPQKRLEDVSKLIASKDKDIAYRQLLSKGDSMMKANVLEEAKKAYQSATVLRPLDQYPKEKINEINRLLADTKADAARSSRYSKIIADADKKFIAKNFRDARSMYQQALLERPLEIYPKKQIQACDEALNPKPAVSTLAPVTGLAAQYPQGITQKITVDAGAEITTVVIIVGAQGWIYTKKVYSWGIFYFKDGQQISETTYFFETSSVYVQKQQAEFDKQNPK